MHFRLKGLRKHLAGSVEIEDELVIRGPLPALPPLVLLADDAAGPAVRRMYRFEDVTVAAEHIDFWHSPEDRGNLIAFWALGSAPIATEEIETEALVLVRDHRDAELVSPFSFVDMESAMGFVRYEMARRLDPSLVSVCWAVPVTVETTVFGTIRLSPERMPEIERPMQVLWQERGKPEAVPAAPRPEPAAERPKSQLEGLLLELASALGGRTSDGPRPAFAGFGSPEGRF